ncbi:unnamed protein product [Anisakis simplex]|uniref:Sodium/hydrogen exchanger n=1 Tax=Anisakis simplex TaxID=6269 RepID=A0A0M3JS62_ANISI|nr:unnamed protein product [Anisakis simplex]
MFFQHAICCRSVKNILCLLKNDDPETTTYSEVSSSLGSSSLEGTQEKKGGDQPNNHNVNGITLFKMHWEHVSVPLTIAFWFMLVTMAKISFHSFERMHNLLPDSALLIVLGLFFGYLFHLIYPDEVYLKPDWFFLYLLPPIALDAGYFMPNKDFFRNFGTIMTYAVCGTLYNTFSIGFTLYLIRGWFKIQPSMIEILIFSTLISAVDPVAVLCVFEEIHVNQLLYICVFGESLLNDAVTIVRFRVLSYQLYSLQLLLFFISMYIIYIFIKSVLPHFHVLYQTFNAMVSAGNLVSTDYVTAGASFFVVSLGGIVIGLIWALFTGFTTKHAQHLNVVQPLICLLFPYLAYLSSEMVAMSGILAIVMCGLTMKQFVVGNLSWKSLVTVQYFMKTLSSSCEAVIFVYLGISAVSKSHDWDIVFITVTVISCLLQRFIVYTTQFQGVFFFTKLLNVRRVQKIGIVDQFIMSYGGIRGAVCYGLVMSLDGQVISAKNMFASCTIVVILFTVFVQGLSIKWLVKRLKVKQNEVHKKTIFEMVSENVSDFLFVVNNMMCGVEGITGYRGHYWLRQAYNRFNDSYIKPHLMVHTKSSATRLVDYNEHIQMKEAEQHLKQYGSFVGLPATQSRANLVTEGIETVEAGVDDSTFTNDAYVDRDRELQPSTGSTLSPRTPTSLPRNQSLSRFVRDKLDSVNSPLSQGVYSRHLLGIDNLPHVSRAAYDFRDNTSFDALDDASYHMTYPYCKGAAGKMNPLRRKSRGGVQTDRDTYGRRDSRSTAQQREQKREGRYHAPRMSLNETNLISRPRFLITSDSNEFNVAASSPPNAPRHPRRKSTEQELEEGLALKLLPSKDQPQRLTTIKPHSSFHKERKGTALKTATNCDDDEGNANSASDSDYEVDIDEEERCDNVNGANKRRIAKKFVVPEITLTEEFFLFAAPGADIPLNKSTAGSSKKASGATATGEPDERCSLLPVEEIDETAESPTNNSAESDQNISSTSK